MKKFILFLAGTLLLPAAFSGEVIFQDSFTTLGNWKKLSGSAGIEAVTPDVEHAPFLKLGNGLLRREINLDQPFTMKAKVLHDSYRRGMAFCFLDAELKKGYGVLWDSGVEDFNNGSGTVIYYNFDLETPAAQWSDLPGKSPRLKSVKANHNAIKPPFADLEISVSADRKITVKMDGIELFTEQLPSTRITNLLLRGNTNSLIDELSIETR